MPLDWCPYNGFDWTQAQQAPLPPEQRVEIEALTADLLHLSLDDRARLWGKCSPPGRYAATVVHVYPEVEHWYQKQAAAQGITAIGVKVFKTTQDARREVQQLLPFHREHIHRLPGLPHDHVQKSLGGGVQRDGQGSDRYYVIQEWVTGETLEDLLRRRWLNTSIDSVLARALLEQLFGKIIIPLWSEGTIWWDIRDANYCWNPTSERLTLIDVDSLAAYADEIVKTPAIWERRDRGQTTALTRLRGLTLRVLLAQKLDLTKKAMETTLLQIWQSELEPALRALGRDLARKDEVKDKALATLHRFLEHLALGKILRHASL
jgi:hypothetical protein